ncbi:hypothetical protein BJX68DRAFT_239159 [Aspergillus pseudodeflectus]|uniref:Uncharacterized protein n=1 Tax=Aspergillus pseudodeflectus TaxID=176178 RepID=A0ABR4K750_9EURO
MQFFSLPHFHACTSLLIRGSLSALQHSLYFFFCISYCHCEYHSFWSHTALSCQFISACY